MFIESSNCVFNVLGEIGSIVATTGMNIGFLTMALKSASSVQSVGREVKKVQKLRKWVRGSFSLTSLLGVTWAVGYLHFVDSYFILPVFSYVFALLNASQGFFIFIFHCLLSENVHQAVLRVLERSRQSRLHNRRPTNTTNVESENHSRSRASSRDSISASATGSQSNLPLRHSLVLQSFDASTD